MEFIELEQKFANLKEIFEKQVKICLNKQKIIELRNICIREEIKPYYKQMRDFENKVAFSNLLSEITKTINKLADLGIENLEVETTEKGSEIDISICDDIFSNGNLHLINIITNDIISFFKKLNFEIVTGPEIVSEKYNFDNLNITKDHVSRDIHDTFYFEDNFLLRTHCTSTSALKLENNKDNDIRLLSYGNVYRKDEDDATHSHQFTQIDFIWLRSGLTLANLKWLIDSLLQYLFESKLKTRYRLSYFPFTEPSFEVDIQCTKCFGNGCEICKSSGWIEILGAGMLNQVVMQRANITSINTGLASGIGVERIAMLKYGINDIRDLYTNDFMLNKQFKG